MKKMFMTRKKLVLRTISTGCTVVTILFMLPSSLKTTKATLGKSGWEALVKPITRLQKRDGTNSPATGSDRTFVLPFGLIQVARDRKYFDPRKNTFDPSILLQDLADPMVKKVEHVEKIRDSDPERRSRFREAPE